MEKISSAAFTDTKPHYDLLDGLRGVAALMVIWYHVFEGFAFASAGNIETLNHGYLAVDFFFILSGFVIGYAYDDRWGKNFTMKDFFKRRLIRLHPMVIMGAVLGAITFCIQGCVQWDGTHVAISMIMLSLLCTIFFIPAMPGVGYEVRGNGEMFPLNGPCWSLFFEYIGNILYALFIRRLSNKALAVLVVLLGMALASFAVFNVSGYGNMGVGWTLDGVNFLGGTLRMLFPFSLGMLMSRNFKPMKVNGYKFDDIRIPLVSGWKKIESSLWQPMEYPLWSVVKYGGEFYTLMTLDSFDYNLNPMVSDNWGAIAEYDPAYNTYELSDHEYVVYKGQVFTPETDVNADIPEAGQYLVLHDPRNSNLKRHMVRLAIYELTKLIAPNNVSVVRIRDYEESMKWLNDAARLRLNPQIPRKLDETKKPVTDWQLATFQTDYNPHRNPWFI